MDRGHLTILKVEARRIVHLIEPKLERVEHGYGEVLECIHCALDGEPVAQLRWDA